MATKSSTKRKSPRKSPRKSQAAVSPLVADLRKRGVSLVMVNGVLCYAYDHTPVE